MAPSTTRRQPRPASRPLRTQLIGAWRLVSCVETDIETGEVFLPMGRLPHGLLLYTEDGYMSAQLADAGRPAFALDDMYRGTPEEYVAASIGYLAYSGPYRVDERNHTVVHGMDVSLFPNWQGQRQVRVCRLEDDRLVLETDKPALFAGSLKHARIEWRRAQPSASAM